MSKTITSEILVAYSQCPRKAYLLLCTRKEGNPHEYARILERQRQVIQGKYLNILRQKNPDVQPYSSDNLKGKHEFLVNALLAANGLGAECAILNKVKTHSALGPYSYEPTIFVGTHSIKKEHKLEIFFVSHVLQHVQNKQPVSGRIINLDEKSHKVKLENRSKTLIPFLEPLQEWAADASPEPPPLILNKHCPICCFHSLCRAKAEQEDNLSLLDGISTPKAINKYEKKGLFTVKQLSYTFKPRKRKKRAKNPPPVTHKPELQALAIREGKIYLQELPALPRQSVELSLDIEGVPDQSFYYLMGLLVSENETTAYHPFWADTPADEAEIWQQFIAQANQYPDAPIYHYGNFDSRTLTKLAKRYDTDADSLTNRLVNINKHIFGKVYFPIYSNRLKEIGTFIGAKWSSPQASGLQSLVWRHHWEETHSDEYKELLLTYNEDDCRALKLLVDELSRIKHSADTLAEVDFADKPKQQATEVGEEIHSQFDTILKMAHANYDKRKISLRRNEKRQSSSKRKRGGQKGHIGYQRLIPKASKVICVPQEGNCPKHNDHPLEVVEKVAEQTIVDLVFTKNGIRKTITKYIGAKGYCSKCRYTYNPPGIRKLGEGQLFGHGLKAWVVYHRLALRLPYNSITQLMEDQFNEGMSQSTSIRFISYFAHYYADTEKILIQRILENSFIHVDETKISFRGVDHFVWVFTDGKHTVFKMTETREATIVHEILSGYDGILISDFYPGYDSIKCRQQKCLSHLIRDINDDLWKEPFDTEFEAFVLEVRNLVVPILEAVEKFGLKKRNLNKFMKQVERFYEKVIIDKRYKSEVTLKYQKRFVGYRQSLFTFLEHNSIPWNNNMAERCLRHLAVQRKISGTFQGYDSTHDYLLLLGITQTCRFQNKSLLKFLLSREKDIDQFKGSKRKHVKTSRPIKRG
jgi:predicted RecB family nuclease